MNDPLTNEAYSALERDVVATKQMLGRLRRNAALVMRVIEGTLRREDGKRAAYEIVEDTFKLAALFAIPESEIDA